ncbi:MAG: FecR domain-containing protein [Cyclobacteriaceae bacterium]
MDKELLRKFFSGECTSEEAHKVLVWINSNKAEQDMLEALENAESNHPDDQVNSTFLLRRIKERLREESVNREVIDELKESNLRISSKSFPEKRVAFWQYAASISLVVLTSLALYFAWDTAKSDSNVEGMAQTLITKRTESGQKLTIRLNDGSLVTLNSNSAVTYAEKFSDTLRFIRMTGEVFFEVAKDTQRPFVVETKLLQTTALGTSFNIDAYSEEEEAVTLITGKVNVESALDATINDMLEPGQRFTTTRSGEYSKTEVDLNEQALWKEGIIYFDDIPIDEGLKRLERWYGVYIEVQNMPNRKLNVSGKFDNDNLQNVLTSLSYTAGFEFDIQEKKVTIKFPSL